jgi:uncharacterized protein YjbJ (UPF0337 family)
MDRDRIKVAARQAKGKVTVKETVRRLMGDTKNKLERKAEKTAGRA